MAGILRETLSCRRRLLGLEHADALATANNLASAMLELGNAAEAVSLFEQVMESACAHRCNLGIGALQFWLYQSWMC